MKAPVPRPTLRLVDKVSRSCGHTPGKVAGQRATVKAEMNGVTPGLDRRPPPRWMGGQGGQSLKVLVRALSDFEVFSLSMTITFPCVSSRIADRKLVFPDPGCPPSKKAVGDSTAFFP